MMANHLKKLFMASPIIVFNIKNEHVDTCHDTWYIFGFMNITAKLIVSCACLKACCVGFNVFPFTLSVLCKF